MDLSIRRVAKTSSLSGVAFGEEETVESFLFRGAEGELELIIQNHDKLVAGIGAGMAREFARREAVAPVERVPELTPGRRRRCGGAKTVPGHRRGDVPRPG